MVGGTGLYIKALTSGIAEMPDVPEAIRAQATSDYDEMGKESFSDRLRAIDPAFFERLKVYDKQRLVRAYEVWLGSGKRLSWWQAQELNPPYPAEEIEIIKNTKIKTIFKGIEEIFLTRGKIFVKFLIVLRKNNLN